MMVSHFLRGIRKRGLLLLLPLLERLSVCGLWRVVQFLMFAGSWLRVLHDIVCLACRV